MRIPKQRQCLINRSLVLLCLIFFKAHGSVVMASCLETKTVNIAGTHIVCGCISSLRESATRAISKRRKEAHAKFRPVNCFRFVVDVFLQNECRDSQNWSILRALQSDAASAAESDFASFPSSGSLVSLIFALHHSDARIARLTN